ncbi:MAG: DUF533 domain-containing protein [Rhizobacter sp.]|nr:DUF533 domain-containing protein [Rhizobacter sp.]
MNAQEQKAILTVALCAAFADGSKHDREREQIRELATSLANEHGAPDLPRLLQDVLLKKATLAQAAAALGDPAQRQLAYEMAVCVCDADGRQTESERAFLAGLKQTLSLDAERAAAFEREADSVVDLAEAAAPAAVVAVPGVSASASGSGPAPANIRGAAMRVDEGALDQSILNYAKLNGALELLPQSWASMAIIPLQIKMVYAVGKAYGADNLDQGHIREFIAAAGVGLTSQYLEQFGRKLIGGLLGGLGRAATGVAFSFATTYALGQVAKRYYAGGRVMSTALLRESFNEMLAPAKQLQSQYLPQIRQQAQTLDMGKVMDLVRKG